VGQGQRIDWKTFLRISLPLAAAVGLFSAFSPLLGSLVLFPGSVFLAVHAYRRRRPGLLKTVQGAKMGIVMGLFSFAFLAAILGITVAHDPAGHRQQMENQMKEAFARNPNPQNQQALERLLSRPHGFVLFLVAGSMVLLVFLLIIGSVFGALAISLVRKKLGP